MPRTAVPLDGPYHHEETPRKDIAATKVKMAKVRYLMAEIKQNARAGSDDAAEAGYNQEARNEVMMVAKECQVIIDEVRPLQAEVDETIEAIRDLERVKSTQSPGSNDPELRRRAAAQVFKFITDSPTGLHTLLSEIGIQVTPEIRNAVHESLAQATDSQTERWIRGAQQTPQVLDLQKALEEKESELSALKLDLARQKKVAFEFQRDRHQAETNLKAERSKVTSSNNSASRAKQELDRARGSIASLEEELQSTKSRKDAIEADQSQYKIQTDNRIAEMDQDIKSLTQQVRDLDEANRDLEDEKETLADQLIQRDREKLNLQASFDYDANLARAEKAVVENKLETSEKKLNQARKRCNDTSQELVQARQSLQTVESNLSTVRGDLAALRQEVDKAQEAGSLLEETISDQRASLEEKDREIQRLSVLLAARNEAVDSQVELASIFLRRMSLNFESDIWRKVAGGVLADSAVAPAAQIPCQPWRVLPSWSHDESLDIREDDRSIHAVALDILAIMGAPSAPADCLLTRLQSLQDLLSDTSPMVSTVSQLLLRSLADAAGDERLHLMHHVLICQIVDLLNQDAAESIEVNLDSRATTLVSALQAWNAESAAGLQMAAALSYPDLAVVGFNRSPPGIVAVSPLNHELRWIDKAQTRNVLTHIELLSHEGGPMALALPLDTRERQLWGVAHL